MAYCKGWLGCVKDIKPVSKVKFLFLGKHLTKNISGGSARVMAEHIIRELNYKK
jgi:hypothetical protein